MVGPKALLARMALATLGIACTAHPAFAAAQDVAADPGGPMARLFGGVIATIVYGLVGIGLVIVGFKLFSAVLPFSVKKELEDDHNLSVGVLLAALVLGISIVVAATIHS